MVFPSKDGKELIVTCNCGCDEGVHLMIDEDHDLYCMTYVNGNFYRDQYGAFGILRKKLSQIWAIIRNRQFCYSEVIMTRDEFCEFKDWIVRRERELTSKKGE
jgi:hypothetical protein